MTKLVIIHKKMQESENHLQGDFLKFGYELDMKQNFLIIFQYPSILSFQLLIGIKLVFFLIFFFSFFAIKTPINQSFIFILFYFSPIKKWLLLTNLTATLHKVIDKKQLSMLSGLEVSPSCMHYLTNFFGRCPLTFKMVHQPIKSLFLKIQFVFLKRWSMFMKNKLSLLNRLHMFESSMLPV